MQFLGINSSEKGEKLVTWSYISVLPKEGSSGALYPVNYDIFLLWLSQNLLIFAACPFSKAFDSAGLMALIILI